MRDEPWLTDEQQRVWRSYLALNRALNERIERDMQQAAGMPMAYYLVLAMLSEEPGHTLRMAQLAERAQMSQSRLSHAVARLEQSGWVRRLPAPDDKRGQLAQLTDEGLEQLLQIAPSHAETVRTLMFDPLSGEQLAQLGDILTLLLTGFEPCDDAPTGP